MNWLLLIFKLIPYVTAGVNIVHKDLTLGEKTQTAQDIIGLATSAAVSALPTYQGQIVGTLGGMVNDTIASTMATLHTGILAPAPAPTSVAAVQLPPIPTTVIPTPEKPDLEYSPFLQKYIPVAPK